MAKLDDAVLDQFGLPLWPLLSAARQNNKVTLANDGIGAALGLRVQTGNRANPASKPATSFDLLAGKSAAMELPDGGDCLEMHFEKFGRTHYLRLPISSATLPGKPATAATSVPLIINRKRIKAQREYRQKIDSEMLVIGASPAVFQLFEQIHHANAMDILPAVLLLGEPGVGKTHIARLLHLSSVRSSREFKFVNAGGGGGDVNIQRGEWIGYGKGHGIQGIEKNGRGGHLMNVEGGTLFVDEFAALSKDLQVIFLSVLENRNIEKVGGESFTPDVRCVFATNADVDQEVVKGNLRRDLLDRIPIRITIPQLRERKGDILLLAKRFAAESIISERCLVGVLRHQWPGNVRELQQKVLGAKGKQKSEGKNAIDLDHFDLPEDIIAAVTEMDAKTCRRELWTLAAEIARDEGYELGTGLQRRAGEILGASEAQASKLFSELGLVSAASA